MIRIRNKFNDLAASLLIRLLIYFYPEKLVTFAYQSILGRDPDAAGLVEYSRSLKKSHNLSSMFTELSQSNEHWDKSLSTRSPELVQQVFQGLLNRDAEHEALENYSAKVAETNTLSTVIADIAQSQEHWHQSVTAHAPELVQQVFQGLLSRDAEHEALSNYVAKLTDTYTLREIIITIRHSKEFGSNFLAEKALQDIANSEKLHADSYVFIEIDAYLPFVIEICEYIFSKYGYKSLIVSLENSSFIKNNCLDVQSVEGVIIYDELIKIIPDLDKQPKLFTTHSFASKEYSELILKSLPDSELIFYSDGFLNLIRKDFQSKRPTLGVVYFGYVPKETPYPVIDVIPKKLIYDRYKKIAKKIMPSPSTREGNQRKVVLYLRYWDKGHYSMPPPVILTALLNIVAEHAQNNEMVIIKSDPRCASNILPELVTLLKTASIDAVAFSDYILRLGFDENLATHPIEYFFALGVLTNAKKHIVLDSGLALNILQHPDIDAEFDLISGIKQEWIPPKFRKGFCEIVSFNVKYYDSVIRSQINDRDITAYVNEDQYVSYKAGIRTNKFIKNIFDENSI